MEDLSLAAIAAFVIAEEVVMSSAVNRPWMVVAGVGTVDLGKLQAHGRLSLLH